MTTNNRERVIDADYLRRQHDFALRTFGDGLRTEGLTDHIGKELHEVAAAPTDLNEWADILILGFDGALRAAAAFGLDAQAVIDAVLAKQARNERRTWPDWRTVEPGKAIEHDREADAEAKALALQARDVYLAQIGYRPRTWPGWRTAPVEGETHEGLLRFDSLEDLLATYCDVGDDTRMGSLHPRTHAVATFVLDGATWAVWERTTLGRLRDLHRAIRAGRTTVEPTRTMSALRIEGEEPGLLHVYASA